MRHAYDIREATLDDAIELSKKLRQADIDEIKASGNLLPLEALVKSLKASGVSKAGFIDGEIVCMFGVGRSSLLSFTGVPWLLASDKLVGHAKPFLKRSRQFVKSLREEYNYLCNFVDARNKESIKWLKWLGFKILPARPYGPHEVMFHQFEMKR